MGLSKEKSHCFWNKFLTSAINPPIEGKCALKTGFSKLYIIQNPISRKNGDIPFHQRTLFPSKIIIPCPPLFQKILCFFRKNFFERNNLMKNKNVILTFVVGCSFHLENGHAAAYFKQQFFAFFFLRSSQDLLVFLKKYFPFLA